MMKSAIRLLSLLCLPVLLCLPARAAPLVSSDVFGREHVAVRTVEKIAALVRARSHGQLDIVVRPDNTISEHDSIGELQRGSQAMMRVSLAALEPYSHAATLASLPYLLRSREHMWKVLIDAPFGRLIDSELEAAGLVRVAYMETSPRNFFCRQPIRSAADFRGRRVGGLPYPVLREMVKNLGAEPVAVPEGELNDTLRAGGIDCIADETVNFLEGRTDARHDMKGLYMIQDEHIRIPSVLLISRRIWDSLPAGQRTLLRDTAVEVAKAESSTWTSREEEAIAAAERRGLKLIRREDMATASLEEEAARSYRRFLTRPRDLDLALQIVGTH